MKKKLITLLTLILAAMLAATMLAGCGKGNEPALPPLEMETYTAASFVDMYLQNEEENPYRAKNWEKKSRAFTLVLRDIKVGDGLLTFHDETLAFQCEFRNQEEALKFSNGDQAMITGSTVKAEADDGKVVLELDQCTGEILERQEARTQEIEPDQNRRPGLLVKPEETEEAAKLIHEWDQACNTKPGVSTGRPWAETSETEREGARSAARFVLQNRGRARRTSAGPEASGWATRLSSPVLPSVAYLPGITGSTSFHCAAVRAIRGSNHFSSSQPERERDPR